MDRRMSTWNQLMQQDVLLLSGYEQIHRISTVSDELCNG